MAVATVGPPRSVTDCALQLTRASAGREKQGKRNDTLCQTVTYGLGTKGGSAAIHAGGEQRYFYAIDGLD